MAFSLSVSGTIKSEEWAWGWGADGSLFEKEKAFSGIMEEERRKEREEEEKKRKEEEAKREKELTVTLGKEQWNDEWVIRRPVRVYCKKCDKMVKSTVKKNWWLMYYHVFLLTRRIIPFLIMAALLAGAFICWCQPLVTPAMEGLGCVCVSFALCPFVFLTMLLKLGIRLSTPP